MFCTSAYHSHKDTKTMRPGRPSKYDYTLTWVIHKRKNSEKMVSPLRNRCSNANDKWRCKAGGMVKPFNFSRMHEHDLYDDPAAKVKLGKLPTLSQHFLPCQKRGMTLSMKALPLSATKDFRPPYSNLLQ